MGTLQLRLGALEGPVGYGRNEVGDGYWARCDAQLASGRELVAGDVNGTEPIQTMEVVLFSPYRDAPHCSDTVTYHVGSDITHANLFIRVSVDEAFLFALDSLAEGEYAYLDINIRELIPRDGHHLQQMLGTGVMRQQPAAQYEMSATVEGVATRLKKASVPIEDPMKPLLERMEVLEERLAKSNKYGEICAWLLGILAAATVFHLF